MDNWLRNVGRTKQILNWRLFKQQSKASVIKNTKSWLAR